jgi:hypothetical protein
MTQYMLSVYHDGSAQYEPDEMQTIYETVDEFNNRLMADKTWVFGGGLEPIEAASTVDGRGNDIVVTDGPFAETKEYLGGFWVIEVPDLDVALKVAADASKACRQAVEVRPFQSE